MYKDLKTLHPGGIRTRSFVQEADAMATMPRRPRKNVLFLVILYNRKVKETLQFGR
jgi:hypothetical protein